MKYQRFTTFLNIQGYKYIKIFQRRYDCTVFIQSLKAPCSCKIFSFFDKSCYMTLKCLVLLNFQAGSTFPVPICTVPSSMDRTSRCNKVDAVTLMQASYRLNLLLLKEQICVIFKFKRLFYLGWLFQTNYAVLQKLKPSLYLRPVALDLPHLPYCISRPTSSRPTSSTLL